ncbi:MAG: hypothetical protein LBP73_04775 [Clostridiales Family XIII bacterium]|nr:hypothetical protein [Clostridiales Family XIII bacterium]
MKSIILQIFENNIDPLETVVPAGEEHQEVRERIIREERRLKDLLPANERERFGECSDLNGRLLELSSGEAFVYGFKLAARIMVECFCDGTKSEREQAPPPD